LIACYERVMLDLGTGDGAAVLRAARACPGTLAIGVDADASGLRDTSRKAAGRNGLPNALFLVGDATEALQLLHRRVDELRITLPWGSLLRRVLTGERDFALAVAGSV
jgi:16S rRNA (adenine(1408)-N(1))-methyltransferase